MTIKKPDLSAQHCESMEIVGYAILHNEVLEKIVNKEQRKERHLITGSQYSKRKEKHLCLFALYSFKKVNKNQTRIIFNITVKSGAYLRKQDMQQMVDSFKILNLIKQQKVIIASAWVNGGFRYPKDSYDSLIPIPYGTTMPILQKVEIVGLRFRIEHAGEDERSQVIDVGDKKTIFHSITFKCKDHLIENDLLPKFLQKLSSYSMGLVKRRMKKSAKK
jgi:hypothetical protein